jgi:hypothetical protein
MAMPERRRPDAHPERPEAERAQRQPAGTEPVTARSPLRLRALLSAAALVGGTALAVVFGLSASRGSTPGERTGAWVVTAIGAVTAVIALIDLYVIARRARR